MITPLPGETADQRTRRLLRANGLPEGLLPPGITDGDITTDGAFWVQLPAAVERRHGGYRVRTGPRVSGRVSHGEVRDLAGVEARQLRWWAVHRIQADGAALVFSVGPVTRRLPATAFPT